MDFVLRPQLSDITGMNNEDRDKLCVESRVLLILLIIAAHLK